MAADSAYFLTPFLRNAVVPEFAACHTFPTTLGRALSNDMLLTGRRLYAHEAQAAGLVSRVRPPPDVLPCALGVALDIARSPLGAKSARIFRRMLQEGRREATHALIGSELRELDARLHSGDTLTAVAEWWAARSSSKL